MLTLVVVIVVNDFDTIDVSYSELLTGERGNWHFFQCLQFNIFIYIKHKIIVSCKKGHEPSNCIQNRYNITLGLLQKWDICWNSPLSTEKFILWKNACPLSAILATQISTTLIINSEVTFFNVVYFSILG